MFDDDGKTFGTITRGEFILMRFKAQQADEKNLTIDIIRDGWEYNGMPQVRAMKLEVVGKDPNKKYVVRINSDKLKELKKDKPVAGYYFNDNRLIVKFNWGSDPIVIRIEEK
jgi:hypothetical protein